MNAIIVGTGGRALPPQNTPMPSAGSRWPCEVRGPRVQGPCSDPVPRSSVQRERLDRARPVALICAASRPSGRFWPRWKKSPPTAMRDPLNAPAPSGTARSRTSGEYLFDVDFVMMTPLSQVLRSPGNPALFNSYDFTKGLGVRPRRC